MSASTMIAFRDTDGLADKLDRLVAAAAERPMIYTDCYVPTRSDAIRTALEFGLRELLARMNAPMSDREKQIAARRSACDGRGRR